jgi:hypothetical protein
MVATDAKTVRTAAVTRLAIGLAQGVLLFLLHHADDTKTWPATQPLLFAPLLVCVLMVPLIVLGGLSAMRRTPLVVWSAVATVLAAVLAVHAAWTGAAPDRIGAGALSPAVFPAVAALLFIAHHLIQPAEAARKPVAPYAEYFDLAWMHGVQLALSIAFTGVFWIVIALGGALFKLIGIDAIQKLTNEAAFAMPATCVMFAAAVQLTDVRAGLVRGVRSVALTLLAWLLPLMTLIAAGFLASLPFTGLAPLWKTKAATALLLSAAAHLIVLINAAYQDGTEPGPVVLRWAARIAGVLLIPIAILAGYALFLRVDQYGLTPERVFAAAFVVVAGGYALGYAIAAIRPGSWMKTLEPTNLLMAVVAVVLLVALFTPIADPARLSVNSQAQRLEAGKVAPEKFDYQFLRFDSGRYGREALDRLKADKNPDIAKRAADAGAMKEKAYAPANRGPDFANMKVYPAGKVLPDSFKTQDWTANDSDAVCTFAGMQCAALVLDIDGDGADEVLLASGGSFDVFKSTGHGWRRIAQASSSCPGLDIDAALKAGTVRTEEPTARRDLLVGDQRLVLAPTGDGCNGSAPNNPGVWLPTDIRPTPPRR